MWNSRRALLDEFSGPTPIERLWERDIEVRALNPDVADTLRPTRANGRELRSGIVDVGKHARASLRNHRACLFVIPAPPEARDWVEWMALKLK